MDRRHHKLDYNWDDSDDIWNLHDDGGDVFNDQNKSDDGKVNEAMEISVNNSQQGEISILKPRQEIETEQEAQKEVSISQTKVDPVMALGLHEFRHIILLLQKSGSLPEILNLVKVSEAWSKAVLKALDSQTELFYFDYGTYALSYYYDLLKTNNLQVDSFYKVSLF